MPVKLCKSLLNKRGFYIFIYSRKKFVILAKNERNFEEMYTYQTPHIDFIYLVHGKRAHKVGVPVFTDCAAEGRRRHALALKWSDKCKVLWQCFIFDFVVMNLCNSGDSHEETKSAV